MCSTCADLTHSRGQLHTEFNMWVGYLWLPAGWTCHVGSIANITAISCHCASNMYLEERKDSWLWGQIKRTWEINWLACRVSHSPLEYQDQHENSIWSEEYVEPIVKTIVWHSKEMKRVFQNSYHAGCIASACEPLCCATLLRGLRFEPFFNSHNLQLIHFTSQRIPSPFLQPSSLRRVCNHRPTWQRWDDRTEC